jgi:uncharacterized Zn-finger protein
MPRRPAPVNDKGEKRCTRCGIFKALDEFPKMANRSDGKGSACRECENKRVSDFHKAHREETNKQVKAWRDKNREHVRELDRAWTKNNPDAVKEKSKRYRLRHPEKFREANKRNHAQYYANNKETVTRKIIEYRKNNPQIASATQRKRRAMKAGATVNNFTHALWVELQEAYDHRCVYCGKRFKGKLTQDHITPLSRGGSHTVSNIVPACNLCNSKKNAGSPPCPIQPLLLTFTTTSD